MTSRASRRRRSEPPAPASFSPIRLASSLEVEAAIYAIRMIEGGNLVSRLVRRGDVADQDILTLIGLEQGGDLFAKVRQSDFRDALSQQRLRLEARRLRPVRSLDTNLAAFAEALNLNACERDTLRLATIISLSSGFSDLFRFAPNGAQAMLQLASVALGHGIPSIQRAMGTNGTLRRMGVLDGVISLSTSGMFELDSDILALLSQRGFNAEKVVAHLLRVSPRPQLTLDDFAHSLDQSMVRRYIASAVASSQPGANVLIYGPPGTGKTEFARALAADQGVQLYEVPVQDKDGDPIGGKRRLRAYSLAQTLLESRERQVLLFDEVEDVFGSVGSTLINLAPVSGGPEGEPISKGSINHILESNAVPSIWVSNHIGDMDDAFLRRFALVVEFGYPDAKTRRKILQHHFPRNVLSAKTLRSLSLIENLAPAQVESAARVVKALRSRSQSDRDQEAERAVSLALRAAGKRPVRAEVTIPEGYDLSYLNADVDMETLATALHKRRSARICLYGPPGTGKTAFGHYLSEVIGRPVHVKRASDLISKWVGETEQNIAHAFRRAQEAKAILIIDEADSFLRDRSAAHHRWEVSAVNEMLAQMESFTGIFIASTNLKDDLDAAAIRRFDFKVHLDFLTRTQRRAMVNHVAGANQDVEPLPSLVARLDAMDRVTPGDVHNVLRQFSILGEAPTFGGVVEGLEKEMRHKPGGAPRRIGFL